MITSNCLYLELHKGSELRIYLWCTSLSARTFVDQPYDNLWLNILDTLFKKLFWLCGLFPTQLQDDFIFFHQRNFWTSWNHMHSLGNGLLTFLLQVLFWDKRFMIVSNLLYFTFILNAIDHWKFVHILWAFTSHWTFPPIIYKY